MTERSSPSFAGVPLGHKLIAIFLALGIALGGHVWLLRRAALSADAAQLSFSAVDARNIDSGLATVHDPAVVLAQSVLTDSVVEQLSSSAPLASTALPSRLGEFRSHLQLTQVSGSALNVRFIGPDNTPSDSTADTIAHAIAKATFSAYGAPLVSAPAPPQSAPAPARATPPKPANSAAAPQPANTSALAAPLGDLDAMLSSTKRDLDRIAFAGAGGRRPSDPARYRESDQQRLLKTRVAAAEQKISQIRSSSAAQDLPRAAVGQLAEIQHAVASILAAGTSGAHGFRNVGIDAAQVRRERAQLDDAIATVHRDRLDIQQASAAPADNSGDTASSTPSSAPSTADIPPPQDAAQSVPTPSSGDLRPNPFTFAENAAAPAPTLWWPTIAAGFLCGLLYWTFAALPDREPTYGHNDMPEPVFTGSNMITPASAPAPRREPEPAFQFVPKPAARSEHSPEPQTDLPPATRTEFPSAAPLPGRTREEEDFERRSRRASFRFEPATPQVRIPEQVSVQEEPAVQAAEETAVEPREQQEPVAQPAEESGSEDIVAAQIADSSEDPSSPQPISPPPLAASDPVPDVQPRSASPAEVHLLAPEPSGQPRRRRAKPPLASGFRTFRKSVAHVGRHEEIAGSESYAERDEDSRPRPDRTDDLAS
jgi:hypothetical protein